MAIDQAAVAALNNEKPVDDAFLLGLGSCSAVLVRLWYLSSPLKSFKVYFLDIIFASDYQKHFLLEDHWDKLGNLDKFP